MASFRKEILQQIGRMDAGRIFTFRDLSFDTEKTANVAVLLSEQSRKGQLVRIGKGAYYRPKKSELGLGMLPVYQDEQFRYLTGKLNGYITGIYAYNKMGLTGQVANTITIATPTPVRRFRFRTFDVECVKAYSVDFSDAAIPYLRLLDAVKDMRHISGMTEQEIYDRLKSQYFNGYGLPELEKIVSLARNYPPRVRRVLSDILGDIGQSELRKELAKTLIPTTRFNLNYKTTYDYELTFGQRGIQGNCSP